MPVGQISEHFTWGEARCHCGQCSGWGGLMGEREVTETAEWAETVRALLGGFAIHVNSWYRCKAYNRSIGGEPDSQHLLGRAVDISLKERSPRTVQSILAAHRDLVIGLGRYAGFTHIDRRDGPPATWRG